MSHLPKPARRLSALVEQEYLKQTGLGSSYFGSIYLWFVCFCANIVWVKFLLDCNFLGQITLGQISFGTNFCQVKFPFFGTNFHMFKFPWMNFFGVKLYMERLQKKIFAQKCILDTMYQIKKIFFPTFVRGGPNLSWKIPTFF